VVPAAVGLGITLMTLRTVRAFPATDLFAQSFDNVFHLAAARFIRDTGAASPWDISTLVRPDGQTFFYPSGWHALVALVAELSNVPIVIASNACLIVLACLVWPVGAVLLTRTIFGPQAPALIAAGALSAGFATYPFMMISTMGTYPLVASIALMPVALAAAVETCGLGSAYARRLCASLLLLASVATLGATHPSALVMLAVMTVPIVVVAAWRLTRERPTKRRLIALSVLLYAVIVLVLMLVLTTNFAQPDSLRAGLAQSLGEVAFSAFGATQITIAVAAATLVGLVTALRRRIEADWVAVGLWATMSLVYVAVEAGDEFVRLVVGGPWYVDANRIAAFTPVVIIPLAAAGASTMWRLFSRWVRRHGVGRPIPRTAVLATAVVVFAAALTQANAVRSADAGLRAAFVPTDNALTSLVGVGPDERELIVYIDARVPADEMIANNPRDGSGFIYPLTGRRLLTAHMLAVLDADREAFYAGIADAQPADLACEIARRLNVRWIVEFHPDEVLSGDRRFDGIQDIGSSPNVELEHRVGDSSLYRLTGCGFDAD
jgi:hypothetical protein